MLALFLTKKWDINIEKRISSYRNSFIIYGKKLIMKILISWNPTELKFLKLHITGLLWLLIDENANEITSIALKDNKSIKDLELLQKQVNENKLIEQ